MGKIGHRTDFTDKDPDRTETAFSTDLSERTTRQKSRPHRLGTIEQAGARDIALPPAVGGTTNILAAAFWGSLFGVGVSLDQARGQGGEDGIAVTLFRDVQGRV